MTYLSASNSSSIFLFSINFLNVRKSSRARMYSFTIFVSSGLIPDKHNWNSNEERKKRKEREREEGRNS